MPNFNDNTTGLQQILETVNALPDAGSGGGGVETCALHIENTNRESGRLVTGNYLVVEDDMIVTKSIWLTGDYVFPIIEHANVVKGSFITLFNDSSRGMETDIACTGCSVIREMYSVGEGIMVGYIIGIDASASNVIISFSL